MTELKQEWSKYNEHASVDFVRFDNLCLLNSYLCCAIFPKIIEENRYTTVYLSSDFITTYLKTIVNTRWLSSNHNYCDLLSLLSSHLPSSPRSSYSCYFVHIIPDHSMARLHRDRPPPTNNHAYVLQLASYVRTHHSISYSQIRSLSQAS